MNRVVVVGNATVDLIQRVDRFPLPGETLLCGATVLCAGGKGLNQAIAAARTGTPTLLRAPVGADAHGALLAQAVAAEAGLTADWLPVECPTDVSTIWIDATGENMIVSAGAAAAAMDPGHAAAACAAIEPGDVLLVQGNLGPATTAAAIALARAQGACIVLNTAPMRPWLASLLAAVDLVVANQVEAAALAAGASGFEAALVQAGAAAVVVSRGRDGATLLSAAGRSTVRASAVAAVDTAGAGDVLTGTLAGLLAQGADLADALGLAVAAASLSVTRPGTTTSFPSRDEIVTLRRATAAGVRSRTDA